MKQTVIMERAIGMFVIKQESKKGYFRANEIIDWCNSHRANDGLPKKQMGSYWQNDSTVEFLKALSDSEKIPEKDLYYTKKGKYGGTWVHPYIAIDLSMWGYVKLKIDIIKWVHDSLIKYRNESGDSFKEMNKIMSLHFNIGGQVWIYKEVAMKIAKACKVDHILGPNRWQKATEEQLSLRNKIQEIIKILSLTDLYKDVHQMVDEAIRQAKTYKLNMIS